MKKTQHIFLNADKGDVYISPQAKDIGIRNIKLSYHRDGQIHVSSEIANLEKIDDRERRSNTKGLRFNDNIVYNIKDKKHPTLMIVEKRRLNRNLG